MPLKFHQTW